MIPSRVDTLRPNGLSRQVRMRLLPEEKEAFQEAARLSGLTLSGWMRVVSRQAAEARLGVAGKQPAWVKR